MKTIIHTNLTDEQRKTAARVLFNRAAPIKRAELIEFVEGCISQLLAQPTNTNHKLSVTDPLPIRQSNGEALYLIDPEDKSVLDGKSDGYIRGWNMVKRRARS